MSLKQIVVIVVCNDYQLHQRADGRNYVADFAKSLKVDCELVSMCGAIFDLVTPTQPQFKEQLLNSLRYSIFSHGAKEIFLIGHDNCEAYERFTTESETGKNNRHRRDLKNAKVALLKEFPTVNVHLYFASLKNGATDEYEIKKVD